MAKKQDLIVGLVFIVGVVLVGYITVTIRGFSSLWSNYGEIEVEFRDVAGLQKGAEVRSRGLRVGQVTDLQLTRDKIRVTFSLERKITLHENAEFQVVTTNPLGGKHVEIIPGSGRPSDRKVWPGKDEPDFWKALGDVLNRSGPELSEVMSSARRILHQVERGDGLAGRMINDPELGRKLDALVTNVTNFSDKLAREEGLVHDFLSESKFSSDVRMAAEGVRRFVDEARTGKGPLAFLLSDEEAAEDLSEVTSSARSIVEKIDKGEGIASELINNKELSEDLKSTMSSVRKFFDKLAEEKGLAWKLIQDEGLANSVAVSAANVQEITEKINRGPGTLSQLINRSELFDDISRVVTLLRESIEDAREQAPINTFVNAIFAAF